MRTRRLTLTALTVLTVLSGTMAVAGTPALGARGLILRFGSPLALPTGVAVDQSNGNVYAADGLSDGFIKVSDGEGGAPAEGRPSQIAGTETPSESFGFGGETVGVAIDNSGGASDGDIYVNDVQHSVVDKFRLNVSDEYEYVCQFIGYGGLAGSACFKDKPTREGSPTVSFSEPLGLTADAAGNVYVADYGSGSVYEFNPAGEQVRSFESPLIGKPEGLAVDAAGNLYIQGYGTHNLVELLRGPSGEVTAEAEVFFEGVTGVAVDRASGHVFVDRGSEVEELNGAHEVIGEFAAGLIGGSRGLAINEATDRVYLADAEYGDVDEFGLLPEAVVTAPSNSHGASATLNGTVNANQVQIVACQFQYGTAGSYGSTVPCPSLPAGTSPVSLSANVTGLASDADYQYRLAITTAAGKTIYSNNATIITVPLVEGSVLTSNITSFAATLTGVIGAGELTPTYHFVYGLTSAYGSSIPQPDASAGTGAQQTVTQTVSGLLPNATYHYALVATNFGGGVTVGPDATFTTRGLVPPSVSTGTTEAITQTTATLNGALDTQGLATTYSFQYGLSTEYGASAPGVQVFAGATAGGQSVAVGLYGLQPGASYHYRLVASNEDGTSFGADQTFTTPDYPASIIQATPTLGEKLSFVYPEGGHVTKPPVKTKSLTRAQKFAKALRACKGKPKSKRANCEKQARKQATR